MIAVQNKLISESELFRYWHYGLAVYFVWPHRMVNRKTNKLAFIISKHSLNFRHVFFTERATYGPEFNKQKFTKSKFSILSKAKIRNKCAYFHILYLFILKYSVTPIYSGAIRMIDRCYVSIKKPEIYFFSNMPL